MLKEYATSGCYVLATRNQEVTKVCRNVLLHLRVPKATGKMGSMKAMVALLLLA